MICGGLSAVEFIEVRSIALLVDVETRRASAQRSDTRIYRRLLKFIVGHGDLSQLATLI